MKPNIKLSLSKLLSLEEYEISREMSNTLTVDEKSFEILLQIEKDLEVFEQMGSDNSRLVLINARRDERLLEEFSSTWFWFQSSHYRDYHALVISNNQGFFFSISNKVYVTQDPNEVSIKHNLVTQLKHFRQCILQTANWILQDNGKEYRRWITHFMPKELRTGVISRQKYYSIICRDPKLEKMEKDVIDIISRAHPIKFQRMTLGIYIQYWSMCYRLLKDKNTLKDINDRELFCDYNNCGKLIKDFDLDTEEDFINWKKEANFYHGQDLQYASISLYSFKQEDGTWILNLAFGDNQWENALKLIIGLDKQHIHLSSYQELIPRLKVTDYLMVSSSSRVPDFYYNQLDNELETGKPIISIELLDPQQSRAICNATRWLDEPYPIVAEHIKGSEPYTCEEEQV